MALAIVNTILGASMGGLSVLILTKVIFIMIILKNISRCIAVDAVGSSSVKSMILTDNDQCSVPVAPCWRWKMEFPHDAQRGPGWHGRVTSL